MVPLTDSMAPAQSVLIIDDEAVNRRLAQVMFQKLGWEVETVDSGDRALLHLAARRYDLILLDISMPGMNGLDVCQHIRADHGPDAVLVARDAAQSPPSPTNSCAGKNLAYAPESSTQRTLPQRGRRQART